ncbi:uncharacterized protein CANTADRAFT_27737 [Suhomyces tanzawaensis NRRL Y-17324]|uniref:Xylanolytic transcriptional activator regulatory domain-containing protein n=1 Tax=Suhomyces tanzawaensis NRRL Y-17324 TaxID=984487 RepID=A0A1E4SB33_9ASCO|nr:uncharacterized protein CANTADRAFT_27737 [Suhomyces tanzawaensis NRRL Y-17324]ODV76724.1 hypothetical protein CANTADRAFT_27737 [Suhomyces tanzawaensis NRRL Y-17324]
MFVRKDVKEKHEYRHNLKLGKIKRNRDALGTVFHHGQFELDQVLHKEDPEIALSSELLARGVVRPAMSRTMKDYPGEVDKNMTSASPSTSVSESNPLTNGQIHTLNSLLNDEPLYEHVNNDKATNFAQEADISKDPVGFVPTDLTQWLFNDEAFLNQSTNSSPTSNILNDLDLKAAKMLEDAFCTSPNFPLANYQTSVDDRIIQSMISYIPKLALKQLGVIQIERCLELYWSICHIQFPILHKPSFDTAKVHPLLLLCIIMMGAGVARFSGVNESEILHDPQDLADTIAVPLRWLVLSSDDFCSPPKAWILQVLIILEIYEILLSSRKLHERAYLHHGLKIQLLRRSPLLGGDPTNQYNDYKELTEGSDAWKSWIELESLKRATLVSFYLDTIHATIFGHEIILFAHQIKLLMPCDDMLWEMSNIDKNNLPPQTETPRFITALTKLLHQQNFDVGPLSKKILLAGLLTIKVQMEKKDLEVTFLDWKPVKESWKDTIYKAIEVWRDDICHEDCCDSRNAFYLSSSNNAELMPAPFSIADKKCKFPIYHLSQTFMRIKQYDCIIFAGASNRMNVKTTDRDYKVVKERINTWANSYSGRISVLHCYIFLNEMLFKGNEKLYYNPSKDPLFHRPNIVALSLFVIWAYNYSLGGSESSSYLEYSGRDKTIQLSNSTFKEDGYDYLKRIIDTLKEETSQQTISNRLLNEYNEILPKIKNKHYLVGFLSLFLEGFKSCQSEVCREYGGLLENCIERSLGKKYKVMQ